MLFPPVLLFSTYLNLSGFQTDSAGLTAAWSGLYLLMARRRIVAGANFSSRLGTKLSGVNVIGCGVTYALGRRKDEES
jgi:hypothetical protein